MLKQLLKELNFSEGEITIYSYLSEQEELTAKEISLNSKLSLSKTYEILEKLKLKSLISQSTRNNVKYYLALPFDSIKSILDQNKEKLINQEELLNKLIKEKPKKNQKINSTNIRIFSDYNGIKSFYLELERYNPDDDYLGFMLDQEILENKTILRLIDNFHKRRSENNKISKIIIEDNKNYNTIRLKKNPFSHYQFKSVKKPFPRNLSIIGNKVIHYNINPFEKKYEIIEIESSSLAKIYFDLFNELWFNKI